MNLLRSRWHALLSATHRLMLDYGTRRRTLFVLASIALLDAFIPVSANILVLVLAILQPARRWLTVATFASVAGLSAFAFALVLNLFGDAGQWFGLEVGDERWASTMDLVNAYGPGALMLLSIFPDIPRFSIFVVCVGGLDPVWIAVMVFFGKLALYGAMVTLVHHLPNRLGRRDPGHGPLRLWLWRRARRLLAYRRRVNHLAVGAAARA